MKDTISIFSYIRNQTLVLVLALSFSVIFVGESFIGLLNIPIETIELAEGGEESESEKEEKSEKKESLKMMQEASPFNISCVLAIKRRSEKALIYSAILGKIETPPPEQV